jgi:transketolase C-terminal domain/subunit
MDKQQLHEHLAKLHAELQQVETQDPAHHEIIQGVARNVQEVLGKEEHDPEHYSGLGERLNDAVAQLEASHPRTTILMRQVIDQLAYLGI